MLLSASSPPMVDNRLELTSEYESPNCTSLGGGHSADRFRHDDSGIDLGAGLENLGNTCFMNSVLQCFMHTVPLLNRIFSDKQRTHSNCSADEFCTLCDLKDLVKRSLKWRVLYPGRIFNNLNYFSSNFQMYQQEDAHEFLQCYLDKLESSFNPNSKDSAPPRSETLVKEVFGGRILSKLTCCSCGNCSETYELSIDMSLEIEDADTLESALKSFTKLEKIEDPENKFTCNECKEKVFVEKQLSLHETPQVAVFHLKRFKNDGHYVEKIDKHVAFPTDLDLLPFTSGNSDIDLQYTLYAIVVHRGWASTSGHYYCFNRISQNMWCKFDDSSVTVVDEEYVLSQQAYILFYSREGTPWFSTFYESHKLCLESEISNTSPTSVLEKQTALPTSPEQKPELPPCFDIATKSQIRNTSGNEEDQRIEFSLHEAACMPTNQQSQNISMVTSHQLETSERINRSPSPEIYRDDPSDAPPTVTGHTRSKRPLDDHTDSMERKQAFLLLKKRFQGSRARMLRAAVMGDYPSPRRKKTFSPSANALHPMLSRS